MLGFWYAGLATLARIGSVLAWPLTLVGWYEPLVWCLFHTLAWDEAADEAWALNKPKV